MAELAIDPVCKMEVDPDTAAASSAYQGTTYYFCAVGCKHAFDESPEKYLSGANGGMAEGAAAAAGPGKKPWWKFW